MHLFMEICAKKCTKMKLNGPAFDIKNLWCCAAFQNENVERQSWTAAKNRRSVGRGVVPLRRTIKKPAER